MILVGWLFGISSSVVTGIVTPLARGMIVGGMAPSTLLLLRLILATILLGGTLGLIAPQKFRLTWRGLGLMTTIGLLAGLEICTFFASLAYMDAATSSIVKSVQPLVVLVLLALAGERMSLRHWLRLGLSVVGIYLLVGIGGSVNPFGVFLIALSLILYALQLVLVQWWLHEYDTWTISFYLSAFMTLVIGGWWFTQGAPWYAPSLNEWILIVVLAIFGTYLARLTLFAAIARIGSGQTALLWPLQTVTAIFLAVIFLHERLSAVQWFGGALVLAATFLALPGVQLRWRRRTNTTIHPPI